jgi:hypothetical protein
MRILPFAPRFQTLLGALNRYSQKGLLPRPSTGGGHKTDTSETTRATSRDTSPVNRTV